MRKKNFLFKRITVTRKILLCVVAISHADTMPWAIAWRPNDADNGRSTTQEIMHRELWAFKVEQKKKKYGSLIGYLRLIKNREKKDAESNNDTMDNSGSGWQ